LLKSQKQLLVSSFHIKLKPLLKIKIIKNKMSKYNAKYLEDKLKEKLEATYVQASDDSDGCGGKFSVVIVSKVFEGKSLLQKHRL